MTDESDSALLRRNVAQMRAFLDLSYARERALLDACQGLRFLLEGAAVAPDRQARQEEIKAKASAAVGAVFSPPALDHGLLISYMKLQARVLAQEGVIHALRTDLLTKVAKLGRDLTDAGINLQVEVETGQQLARMVGVPEMADRVREVVMRAVEQERERAKPKDATT